jgi:hypothetical protein
LGFRSKSGASASSFSSTPQKEPDDDLSGLQKLWSAA